MKAFEVYQDRSQGAIHSIKSHADHRPVDGLREDGSRRSYVPSELAVGS